MWSEFEEIPNPKSQIPNHKHAPKTTKGKGSISHCMAQRAPGSYNPVVKHAVDKKKRLAQYRKTIEALEQVRARELANMTDEEALRKIESLQCAGEPWRARPDWSGLIELQAVFHRRNKKRRQG